jgi:hypothetical protein
MPRNTTTLKMKNRLPNFVSTFKITHNLEQSKNFASRWKLLYWPVEPFASSDVLVPCHFVRWQKRKANCQAESKSGVIFAETRGVIATQRWICARPHTDNVVLGFLHEVFGPRMMCNHFARFHAYGQGSGHPTTKTWIILVALYGTSSRTNRTQENLVH